MPRTITLTESTVTGIAIDPNDKRLIVTYNMTNEDGTISQPGTSIFVPDLPKNSAGEEVEDAPNVIKMTPKVKEAYEVVMKYIESKTKDEVK